MSDRKQASGRARANGRKQASGRGQANDQADIVDALAGFEPVDSDAEALGSVGAGGSDVCWSRAVLEAFLESGEECIGRSLPDAELKRQAGRLRSYQALHASDFADVGIAQRYGMLVLYRIDAGGDAS